MVTIVVFCTCTVALIFCVNHIRMPMCTGKTLCMWPGADAFCNHSESVLFITIHCFTFIIRLATNKLTFFFFFISRIHDEISTWQNLSRHYHAVTMWRGGFNFPRKSVSKYSWEMFHWYAYNHAIRLRY